MEQNMTVKEFIHCLNQQKINKKDLEHLLESNHSHLVQIFEAVLKHAQYRQVAKKLVKNMIGNMYKMINQKLELFIISNIWKQPFLDLFHHEFVTVKQQDKSLKSSLSTDIFTGVYMFLCQKMRSLKFQVRLAALKSFQQLLRSLVCLYSSFGTMPDTKTELTEEQTQGFDKFLSRSLKRMLKKQELAKAVSYNQGLFLQLLEDEFHEIRVTTLAVLELVSLNTPYFYSLEVEKGESQQNQLQTLQSLKQTILYMLNDEHELVRERSLVAIFRISQAKTTLKRIDVFSPLSRQEIFTILMCLRENNPVLREKVYECLKVLSLMNIDQLLLILEKLYQTLLTYKQDKTKIYLLLKSYSSSQKKLMLDFIDKDPKQNIKIFYDYNYEEEPNCKNVIYKGKIILLRQIVLDFVRRKVELMNEGKNFQRYVNILPEYIVRHVSYVEDTEFKLKFCENLNGKTKKNNFSESNSDQKDRQPMLLQQQTTNFQSKKQKIERLTKFQSILSYEFSLTQKGSFQNSFLQILLDFLLIVLDELQNHTSKSQQHKYANRMEEQNLRDSELFDVIVSGKENKECFYEEISSVTRVDECEIERLLYGDRESKSKTDARKKSITQRKSQTLFQIQAIKYIYSLDPSTSQSLYRYHSTTLINSILLSLENTLNFHTQYFSDKLYKEIEQYLRGLSKRETFKEKRFRLRPISIGRNSLGTGYSDKLLIMVEHPQKIRDLKQCSYQNKNIWVKISTIRTELNVEKNQFKPSTKSLVYYVKFEEIFTLSEMRPLIDYNENKTMYSAELPLKIVESKECLWLKLLKSSSSQSIGKAKAQSQNEPKAKIKKVDELNVERYIQYQEREIVVKGVALVFVSESNRKGGNDGVKNEKVLAEWSAGIESE